MTGELTHLHAEKYNVLSLGEVSQAPVPSISKLQPLVKNNASCHKGHLKGGTVVLET